MRMTYEQLKNKLHSFSAEELAQPVMVHLVHLDRFEAVERITVSGCANIPKDQVALEVRFH